MPTTVKFLERSLQPASATGKVPAREALRDRPARAVPLLTDSRPPSTQLSAARGPVLMLTHEFPPRTGGIATFAAEMARALATRGRFVEVWAQDAGGLAEPPDWPFKVRRLPMAGTHDLACVCRLGAALVRQRRRVRRSIVYVPEPGPMEALMWLQYFRAFRPGRLWLTFHGTEVKRFAAHPLKYGLMRSLLARAERVSVLTRYTEHLLAEAFPEADPKIFITPGALRTGLAEGVTMLDVAARAAREPLVVLTVGRLHPRKGQLQTLQALAALPSELRSRVEYHVVGRVAKPAYATELRRVAHETDLTVRFFDEVDDAALDRHYADADVFALTSIDHGYSVEGFGLVYLEASAHGLPVVAHRVGGVSEAVQEGVTGLLVPPHDQEALTAAFAWLLQDGALRRRLGTAGVGWARQHSWDRAAELMESAGEG